MRTLTPPSMNPRKVLTNHKQIILYDKPSEREPSINPPIPPNHKDIFLYDKPPIRFSLIPNK